MSDWESGWGDTPINTRNHESIAEREFSVDDWDQVGNPFEGFDNGDDITHDGPRATEWLVNSKRWNRPFPKGWEGIKVLGCGGFGIAGHWQYRGNEKHMKGSVQAQVRDIVVKQASAVENRGLIGEADIMEKLTKTGSRHFPQIYGHVHRDVGHQEWITVDQKRREVHRIFMEYFDGGSVGRHIQDNNNNENVDSEDTLWSWFHCFAKAVVAMERGNEQDSEARFSQRVPWVQGNEVVHFDIKPENALIGVREGDGEHMEIERVVISDVGISACLPNERNGPHRNRDHTLNKYEQVGTVPFRAPEQFDHLPNHIRRYSSCTNIFQIGCIMFCLIMKVQNMPRRPPLTVTLTGHDKKYLTYGSELQKVSKVDKGLRGLIAECLFREPDHRPTAIQLLKRTREGLRTAKPRAAEASKLDERLTPITNLLLDQWFGEKPKYVWPKRIPEMEKVVNQRMRQMYQVECAKDFAARRREGLDPRGGKIKGHNQPACLARGQNPPKAGPDPLPHRKPWPGAKFGKPIDIINDKRSREPVKPERENIFKNPNWGKLASRLQRPPAAAVPRPQKRPPPEPEAEARANLKRPRPNNLGNWLNGVDLNRAPAPARQSPRAEQDFLMPVRIWPGPSPNPADEAKAELRSYVLPIGATIAVLKEVMLNDPTSGIRQAVRCQWSRPGTTEFLPKEMQLTILGYGPSRPRRMGPLECFRTMNAPRGPVGEIKLVVHVAGARPQPRAEIPKLKFRVSHQSTIHQLKLAIICSGIRSDFCFPSQLRIHCEGRDPERQDCPDQRTIASFFEVGDGEKHMWCSKRPLGERGRVFKSDNAPQLFRMQKRFL